MANLNKVFLIGRLVADPQLSHTNTGTPFTRFRIAVNNPYRDRSGNWQEDTLFIDIVLWGDAADRAVSRFSKGSRVLVEGRLRQSNWETEEGEKRSRIEVRADRVVGLDPRREQNETLDEIDDIEF
ncbi:single-strand binding protein [Desulfurobacterium thermolithotrophum DSM 11699]|uniref:Single-stranded DNA-binding protein n=1 Tax=Desulfurobacterium thermolithotrophum (strain DSM 11699 / BSA) TaxID=868864 RepID=F0S465_DESTD|nr:single-stranded DNA-binding protein [Desulfurobacterium thermolithotrophum]ADY73637.1 single-strand binding protein [Desulfurobacterium thermolithotrophum DSM 11699]